MNLVHMHPSSHCMLIIEWFLPDIRFIRNTLIAVN
jgi:hypothetical protein